MQGIIDCMERKGKGTSSGLLPRNEETSGWNAAFTRVVESSVSLGVIWLNIPSSSGFSAQGNRDLTLPMWYHTDHHLIKPGWRTASLVILHLFFQPSHLIPSPLTTIASHLLLSSIVIPSTFFIIKMAPSHHVGRIISDGSPPPSRRELFTRWRVFSRRESARA